MGAFKVHRAPVIDLYAWFAHTAVGSCRRLITQKVAVLMIGWLGNMRMFCWPVQPLGKKKAKDIFLWDYEELLTILTWPFEYLIVNQRPKIQHFWHGSITERQNIAERFHFHKASPDDDGWRHTEAIKPPHTNRVLWLGCLSISLCAWSLST